MYTDGSGVRMSWLILLAICCFMAQTESAEAGSRVDTLRSDVRGFKSVCWRTLKSPVHAGSRALWITTGAVSVVALHSNWATNIANVGHAYQSIPILAGTMGGFYIVGTFADKPRLRDCAIELMEAQLIAAVGTQLVKFTVGRDRPYMNNGPSHFVGPNLRNGHQSFFSGDATAAFVQASVLSAEAKSLPITLGLYGLAASTAFQRLYMDQHWLSDTAAAAIWGTAVGLGVVHLNHHPLADRIRLSISPAAVQVACRL
jgi:membrane-associated phospholipid phosphatase